MTLVGKGKDGGRISRSEERFDNIFPCIRRPSPGTVSQKTEQWWVRLAIASIHRHNMYLLWIDTPWGKHLSQVPQPQVLAPHAGVLTKLAYENALRGDKLFETESKRRRMILES